MSTKCLIDCYFYELHQGSKKLEEFQKYLFSKLFMFNFYTSFQYLQSTFRK